MKCNLCQTETKPFYKGKIGEYYKCEKCKGISLSPKYFPTAKAEKERYETHINDIEDVRYQKFVSPIVQKISTTFSTLKNGLDYGCGTGPVIHHLLKQKGFSIDLYDPIFKNNKNIFSNKYDFIACCEVIEHFHQPQKEFSKLHLLLNYGGKLYCMTDLYHEEINFEKWYYKNDPTHVFFYHPKTIKFIQKEFGFKNYKIENRLIVFEK